MVVLIDKLDKNTAKEWENQHINEDFPSYEELVDFLQTKATLLENLEARSSDKNVSSNDNSTFKKSFKQKPFFGNKQHSLVANSSNSSCYYCKSPHNIYNCPQFLKLSPKMRYDKIKSMKHCINCLRPDHGSNSCPSRTCNLCHSKHNTLLHFIRPTEQQSDQASHIQQEQSESVPESIISHYATCRDSSQFILSTAIVDVQASNGKRYSCKALLDSASSAHFITKNLADKLGIKPDKGKLTVGGIGSVSTEIDGQCNLILHCQASSFKKDISCFVIHNITDHLPLRSFSKNFLTIPNHVQLADSSFNQAGQIDLLVGAGLFWQLLKGQTIQLGSNMPILTDTHLGWVISGPIHRPNLVVRCHVATIDNLESSLQRFWEVEQNIDIPNNVTNDDLICETQFLNTHERLKNGRFVVRIPFNDNIQALSDTYAIAEKRLYSLERRFTRDPQLKQDYSDFINEYILLGHMSPINSQKDTSKRSILPHHAVLREESITTKLRVVFDGSAKANFGFSLNEAQIVGPKIQTDLFPIILRFRQNIFAVTADIKQMYRQVQVHKDDRCYQTILWRQNSNDPIQMFELNTVTYGTASAPYLAIRCLRQLGIENLKLQPEASNAILSEFYVDDFISGANNLDDLTKLCVQVKDILKLGCFNLHKWASNSDSLLVKLANSVYPNNDIILGSKTDQKALGMCWSTNSDQLFYKVKINSSSNYTKREILSSIARIFDPLGLLGPVIIIGKITIQKLWSLKLGWDDKIPQESNFKWLQICKELESLSTINVNRCVIPSNGIKFEFHGFCDASPNAYGACIYVRSLDQDNNITVNLLCAKSRVAPLKALTIPRLELCGAVMLAQLMNVVINTLTIPLDAYYWCDSQVVLHWINTSPSMLNIFVSNRVHQINNLSLNDNWYYVNTKDNPADLLSRGISPNQLASCQLWWHGPLWLQSNDSSWIQSKHLVPVQEIPELKANVVTLVVTHMQADLDFSKHSNLRKMINIVAYILRWKTNSQIKIKDEKVKGPIITLTEYNNSLLGLIKSAQYQTYSNELSMLATGSGLNSKSSLLPLAPFIDSNRMLRVGGRLRNSQYNYDKKHPLILPRKHYISKLLLEEEHIRLCHAGPQQTLFSSRDKYWIVSGKTLAKQVVKKCLKCFRYNAKPTTNLMGELPPHRVAETYPFFSTGIDYAGPFQINNKRGRGSIKEKCYVCLFICMPTKAIHLEAVTSLNTETFMATLRRFISRRGNPKHVYSDNGRNFVGANAELQELGQFLLNHSNNIETASVPLNVQWHFIPPYSPNFGGLWEAGIKATKFHMKRVLSTSSLVYEEFVTILVQIEAILNSRPLCPMSSDPNDLTVLTPAHFIIGRPLTALPDLNMEDCKLSSLSRLQYIQLLQQQYWKRWKSEYINQLQVRSKWSHRNPDIQVNSLVLLKEDNAPPLVWKMGRVHELHPGKDGIPRVVTLQTATEIIKRSISKICPLPIEVTCDE